MLEPTNVPGRSVMVALVALPILTAVAAPNRLPVNALVLNTDAVAVLDVTMLGLAPFMLNVVAVVPVIVGIPIVNVPVAAPMLSDVAAPAKFIVVATVLYKSCELFEPTTVPGRSVNVALVALPMLTAVAAPNKLPVNTFVLNIDPVPVLDVTMLGLAPFMLNVVALVPVIVGLPIVSVPVAAPIPSAVAAPAKFIVVAVVLARLNELVDTVKSPPSMFTSPSTSKLLLIFVVPVAAPISSVVAAPAKFTVVALALTRLNVVELVVISPPLTARSPVTVAPRSTVSEPFSVVFKSTSKLFRTIVVPVAAPKFNAVAAPKAFTVVLVAARILTVTALEVMSPPLTARSPVTTVLALRIVVVPVVEPIVTAVPAPAKFTVAALALIKLNVAAVVVKSPPLTARSPVIVTSLPKVNVPSTCKSPSTFKSCLIVVKPVGLAKPIVIAVAAPNAFTVVAVVLARLNVPALVVISPPSTLISPSTSRLLRILVVPVVAANTRLVAAPNAFTVVAVVLAKLKVVVLTVKSPPSILTSPSTSRLLLMLVVPVAAPISNVVAAPAKLTVVAEVLTRLNVAVLAIRSPPSIVMSPSTSKLFLTLVNPVAAPISNAVAAPAKLTEVAVVFNKLNVV